LFQKKLRDIGDKEMRNITDLKINELLGAPVKPAEILNSFFYFDFALLDSFNTIFAEFLGN
jgi:hypothetical protein